MKYTLESWNNIPKELNYMKERSVRIRVHEVLYKELRIICAERDITLPKMVGHLIRQLIDHDKAIKKTLMENINNK